MRKSILQAGSTIGTFLFTGGCCTWTGIAHKAPSVVSTGGQMGLWY